MMDAFASVPMEYAHHLLGPRTAFIVGSVRADGQSHLCAATNVTNISNEPQMVAVALWHEWESTANILERGELTLSLLDADYLDNIWIVGNKYSGVTIPNGIDKFTAAGLTPLPSERVAPSGVQESLAVMECVVRRSLTDVGDHVIFLAEIVAARHKQQYFDHEAVIDVFRAHPVMQITGTKFAQCDPTSTPDTQRCNELVGRHAQRVEHEYREK